MPRYRVHFLDPSGKVIGVGQFDSVNSEAAQAHVKQLAGDLDTELWQLIAPFEPCLKPAQRPVGQPSFLNEVALGGKPIVVSRTADGFDLLMSGSPQLNGRIH